MFWCNVSLQAFNKLNETHFIVDINNEITASPSDEATKQSKNMLNSDLHSGEVSVELDTDIIYSRFCCESNISNYWWNYSSLKIQSAPLVL